MAHNLNFNKRLGRHSFVSVKEIPWHKLGKIVDNRMTSAECIMEAGLDYTVEKGKVFVKYEKEINEAKGVEVPDSFCTYREDTGEAFSIVGSRYEVIQNMEAFSFFDSIVGERRAIYETAGVLGKGETVFITAKFPDHMLIGGKDVVDKYLLLTMSHDGTGSIIAKFTPIRVVCNNTLAMALSGRGNIFKIKHTAQARDRMEVAASLLNITYKTSKETEEILNELTKINISDQIAEAYVLDLILNKDEIAQLAASDLKWHGSNSILSTRKVNTIKSILDYRENGPGQSMEICKGTSYGIYNTITGYLQNVKNFTDDDKKFKSLLLGTDYKLNTRALDLAMTLTY